MTINRHTVSAPMMSHMDINDLQVMGARNYGNPRLNRLRDNTEEQYSLRAATLGGAALRHMTPQSVQKRAADGGPATLADAIEKEYGADAPALSALRQWETRWFGGGSTYHQKADVGAWDPTGFLPPSISRPIIDLTSSTALVPRGGFQRVPFDTPIPVENTTISAERLNAYDQQEKPVSAASYSTFTLPRRAHVSLFVLTGELARFSGATADAHRARQASEANAVSKDSNFMSDLVAAGQAVLGQGDPALDILELLRNFTGGLKNGLLIMSSKNAIACVAGGNVAFSGLTATGGVACGIRTIAADAAGDVVALVDANRVLLADESELSVRVGAEASIMMNDMQGSPAQAGPLVHMFQSNAVAVRAESYANWAFASNAVAYVDGVDYAATGSPS